MERWTMVHGRILLGVLREFVFLIADLLKVGGHTFIENLYAICIYVVRDWLDSVRWGCSVESLLMRW